MPTAIRVVRGYAVRLCVVLAGAVLAACGNESGPPVAIDGGGFIFNYRIAEVFYGISVKPLRKLAAGTKLEAEFENPAGGAPFTAAETITGSKLAYSLRTPAVTGVVADRDYKVVLRVTSPEGAEIGRVERVFRSQIDQDVMPDKPLTVGPGYTPNPETAPSTDSSK